MIQHAHRSTSLDDRAASAAFDAWPMSGSSKEISFEDIDTSSGGEASIPDGYKGFEWTNIYVANPAEVGFDPRSGFVNGLHGKQDAFTAPNVIASIKFNGTVVLDNIDLTAAWDHKCVVQVLLMKDGHDVVDYYAKCTDRVPTHLDSLGKSIDEITFKAQPGSHDHRLEGKGNQIVLDNIQLSQIQPDSGHNPTASKAAFAASDIGADGHLHLGHSFGHLGIEHWSHPLA